MESNNPSNNPIQEEISIETNLLEKNVEVTKDHQGAQEEVETSEEKEQKQQNQLVEFLEKDERDLQKEEAKEKEKPLSQSDLFDPAKQEKIFERKVASPPPPVSGFQFSNVDILPQAQEAQAPILETSLQSQQEKHIEQPIMQHFSLHPLRATSPTDSEKALNFPEKHISLINRPEALQKLRELMTQVEEEQKKHRQLQIQVSIQLMNRKMEEEVEDKLEKNLNDLQSRYDGSLISFRSLLDAIDDGQTRNKSKMEELKIELVLKQEKSDQKYQEFIKYRRRIAHAAEHSKTGKSIPNAMIEQLDQNELKKSQEITKVLLENYKLKRRLMRIDQVIRQKEELADGLHLIDFEQLKIENQTFLEKIEERNQEAVKLKKKIMNMVQMLTHVREKLDGVERNKEKTKSILEDLDAQVQKEKDDLPILKTKRDQLRKENQNLRYQSGLLGFKDLLLNFEKVVDKGAVVEENLNSLKQQYSKLTSECQRVQMKLQKINEQI